MMKKNIFFLRHLETSLNKEKIISGQLDSFTILNDNKAEINFDLSEVSNFEEIQILSSPLKRCVDTANILKTKLFNLKSELVIIDELKERGFGCFEGKEKNKLVLDNPSFFYNNKFIFELTPPDGESLNEVEKRADKVIFYLNENKNNNIIICSHNHFMKILITKINKIPLAEISNFNFKNGEIINLNKFQ